MTRPIRTDIIANDRSTATILRIAAEYEAMSSKLTRLNNNLESAQQRAAKANQAVADAMHQTEDSINRANGATDRYNSRWQRLLDLTLIAGPALAGAAIALAAGAAAGVIGLGALGAVGKLAFDGISDAIKANTALGKDYVVAFKPIKAEYESLETLAAKQVFPGIAKAMLEVRKLFPLFESDVRILGADLGKSISNLAQGIVPAVRQLNPLFLTMGQALVRVTGEFAKWAQGGGFTQFVAYAKKELPVAAQVLQSVGQALFHIAEALKPFGSITLGGIDALSKAIAGLPVPVLQAFIVTMQVSRLLAISAALRSISVALVTTPLGLLLIAVAAVVAGLYELWTHWNQIWGWMSHHPAFAVIIAVLGFIVAPFIAIEAAIVVLARNWSTVWNGVKSVALTVWGALQTAWNAVIGAFKTAVSTVAAVAGSVVTAWKTAISGLQTAWNTVSSAATTAWNAVVKAIKTAIDSVKTAITNVGSFFSHIWDSVWDATVNTFTAIGAWLHQHWPQIILWTLLLPVSVGIEIYRHWGVIKDAIVGVFQAVLDFIKTVPGKLQNIFQTAGAWLVNAGKNIILGLVGGIVAAALTLWDWYKALRARIDAFLTNAGQWLIGTGKNLITGFVNGIVAAAQAVWNWLRLLPGRILGFLQAAGNWLVQTGRNLINGFVNGIVAAAAAVWTWLQQLPGRILGFFRTAINWLFNSGSNVLTGFLHGIWAAAVAVYRWFSGLPDVIRGFFTGALGVLLQAGKDIVQGFWDGMLWVWHKITGWVGGLVKWIQDHKGPLSYDRTALFPAGRALMEGLFTGLMHGFTNVIHFVGGIAGWLKNELTKQTGGGQLKSAAQAFGGSFGQWLSQAMKITGAPADWAPALATIAKYESGYNPNAINLSDSNAANGDPSRGLMQTIGATFLAYHQAGTSYNIYDPVANIAAAINYIRARYGSAWNVPGVVSLSEGGGYIGYKTGAWDIARNQLAWLHKGEMVVPEPTASQVRQGGALSAKDIGREVAMALTGMAIQFDADGVARLVTKRQNYLQARGIRR